MAEALNVSGLSAGYGPTVVLEDISFTVDEGETVSIIGRNGVGKTTLLDSIMGHTTRHGGSIVFHGRNISRHQVFRRAQSGMGYVPQEREIFPSLSLRENLLVGARPGTWTIDAVFELFPHLAQRADNAGNQLSGGEQQMLAIARALMGNPMLLLMDEPSEGLAPIIVEELVAALRRLRETGTAAILLVEQNSRIALTFSERIMVMDRGRITYDGPSGQLRDNPERLDALIGVSG